MGKRLLKYLNWQVFLGAGLILLSAIVYLIHYLIFRDPHHIFIYLIGDIAFVFIEVLLVSMVIHQLLREREKRLIMTKLNMVIGAFFSEVGNSLMKVFSQHDSKIDTLRKELIVTNDWSESTFSSVSQSFKGYECQIALKEDELQELKSFLTGKRNFLLRLLENPNLLEHESFTELLWAVFHLTEELDNRVDLAQLSRADYQHITIDIKRAYLLLLTEWLAYMKHLKTHYPYLFSLAMRTNPLDPDAQAEIK